MAQARPREELQEVLGVRFQDPELLTQSLVHISYVNEQTEPAPVSNERLEFLGDAFLGYVVAAELFRRHPDMPEGRLTAARASLVNRDALARVAGRLALGDFLLLGQGEENTGGRERPSNLADAVEALVGAVLLDRGADDARELVLRLMAPGLDRLAREGVIPDAKSKIQELLQRCGGMRPTYRVVREAGPDHAKHFLVEALVGDRVVGRGAGNRKADAEQSAARDALRRMESPDRAEDDVVSSPVESG